MSIQKYGNMFSYKKWFKILTESANQKADLKCQVKGKLESHWKY